MGREDCIDLTSFFEQVMAKLDKLSEERQKTINHTEKQQEDEHMSIDEAYSRAQQQCTPPTLELKCGVLDASHGLDTLDADSIECLRIRSSYAGTIPELSLFPRLKDFDCYRSVSPDYISRQNLSSFKALTISIDFCPATIRMNAPNLEELTVFVSNNESDQLDMFTMGQKTIDLSLMPRLEKLMLHHCTHYGIISDISLPHLTFAKYSDCRHVDFSHLRFMPNLTHLVITGCNVSKLSFIKYCCNVKNIDLSYNDIVDANELLSLPLLQKANLYRNPLNNTEQLSKAIFSVILSSHDKEMDSYLMDLRICENRAYMMVQMDRKSNPNRTQIHQRFVDHSTNEELFTFYLKSFVSDDIRQARQGKKSLSYKSITPEEMLILAIQEYPFIGETLAPDFSNITSKLR